MTENRDIPVALVNGVARRRILRFGTLATAASGASAITALAAKPANATVQTPSVVPTDTYATTEQLADAVGRPSGVSLTTDTTLTPVDAGKVLTFTDAADHTITVPLASGAGIQAGSEVDVVSAGTGRVRLKPPTENLWPYPDSEVGALGIWYGRAGATSSVAGAGPDGYSVTRSKATSASPSGAFGMYSQVVKLKDVGLRPGDQISGRMWMSHSSATTNARFEIAFTTGASVIAKAPQPARSGNGVRNVVGLSVPVGCDGLQLFVYSSASAAGQTLDITQVMIAKSAGPLSPYFDGDHPGGFWLGTPHASSSSNGILVGDRTVPKRGRVRVRHIGGNVWTIATMGVPDTVLTEDTVLSIDRDNGQGGLMGPARPIGSTVAALVPNTCYAARICPSRPMIIKSMGFRVMSPSSSDDPIEVGIIDSAGTRLVSSGAIRGKLNSGGTKNVSIPDTMLQSGAAYYPFLSAQSAASLLHAIVLGDAFGTAMPLAEAMVKSSSFPVGPTMTGMSVAHSAPLIWVRES